MKKEKNDSKDSQRGDWYQALVAIKYALEYTDKPFDKLTIEHHGDVTFDDHQQIEVKHHSKKTTLGDCHIDFWKTLYNWCDKEDKYEKLILHTTASFPTPNSELRKWNKLSNDDRYNLIINIISNNKAKGVDEYMEFIKDMDQDKLKSIISKIEIKINQPIDTELITQIAQNPTIQIIPCKPEDREDVINNKIAGFIQAKVMGEKIWQISWNQLIQTIQSICRDYLNEYYNPIFDKYFNTDINKDQYDAYNEKRFVNELTQISCEEDEVRDAINDFWKTSTLLAEEIENNPTFHDNEFHPYKNRIVYPKLISQKRVTSMTKPKDSLYFYRKAKELNVGAFKSIPEYPYFKHGTMQIIVEDDNLNFSWLYDRETHK